MQQAFGVAGQIGVDDEAEVRQVDAAGSHICGHTDPGPPIAHGLQRMGTLALRQFTRQADRCKPAVRKPRQQVVHRRAGIGEDDGPLIVVKAQQVEDCVFCIGLGHAQRLIRDVGVLIAFANGADPQRVILKLRRQLADHGRHGGRKHQGASLLGRGLQHELEIFPEAEIEHLVGFVQHDGPDVSQIEHGAFDVIAQAAGRSDNDMRAAFQGAPFLANVHPANTGSDARAGFGVEPAELLLHLHGQFARGRHHESKRRGGRPKACFCAQQGGRDGQAKAHGFARSSLGRNQQIPPVCFRGAHGLLNGGQSVIATLGQRFRQGRDHDGGST